MMHGNRSRSSPRSTIRLLRFLICARFKHRRSGTVEWDTLSLPYSVAAPDRGAIILLHLNDEQNNPCMNAFLSLLLRGISSGNDKVRQPDISNKADPVNRFSSFFERASRFTRKSGLTCSVEFCFHDHGSFRNLSVGFRPTQTSLRCVFRPGLLIQNSPFRERDAHSCSRRSTANRIPFRAVPSGWNVTKRAQPGNSSSRFSS